MRFKYEGKTYDTAKSKGDESTNSLQITDDPKLKQVVINEWFGNPEYVIEASTKEDLMFDFAIMAARYQDIIEALSQYSKPGTYPDWVIESANEIFNNQTGWSVREVIQNTTSREDLVDGLKKLFAEVWEW